MDEAVGGIVLDRAHHLAAIGDLQHRVFQRVLAALRRRAATTHRRSARRGQTSPAPSAAADPRRTARWWAAPASCPARPCCSGQATRSGQGLALPQAMMPFAASMPTASHRLADALQQGLAFARRRVPDLDGVARAAGGRHQRAVGIGGAGIDRAVMAGIVEQSSRRCRCSRRWSGACRRSDSRRRRPAAIPWRRSASR